MLGEFLTITQFILPLFFIIGASLIGLIFEKIIFKVLRRGAAKTKWEGAEIIITALYDRTLLLFVLGGIYGAILSIPISPNLLGILQKILLVVVILVVSLLLARVAGGFADLYTRKAEGILPSTSIFRNLTKILVFLIGVLVVLQSLGISITPMLTALGVGGVAVALALQDTLSNLFSGLHILAAKQIKPGDYIKLDTGEEGHVADINWRNTTIRARPNNMVVVPNLKLASAIITNYYLPEKEIAIQVEVGISYGSDLEKVEEITIDVAKDVMKEVEGGIQKFEPFIRYHTFADFSINFTVILRAKEYADQYLLKHEFIKKLYQRYNDEGIEIPFPVRTVYVKEEKT